MWKRRCIGAVWKLDAPGYGLLFLLSLIFTRKAMHLMVRFPNSWFNFLSRKKSIIAMFISCLKKSEKKCLLREVYSAMSHVILIAETRVYICHKNMKSMGLFYSFFESFRGKIYKIYIYSTGNEEWIESKTVTITCDYVITWAFHKLTCKQNKCTYTEKTNNILIYFSLTVKDKEIFPKLPFWILYSTIDFLILVYIWWQ